jgi:hypothetical protein
MMNYSLMPTSQQYKSERDNFIRQLENPWLSAGDLSYLKPYYDGSIAVGFGYDLIKHNNSEITSMLSQVGGTITSQGENLLAQARTNPSLFKSPSTRAGFLSSLSSEISLPSLQSADILQTLAADQEFEPQLSTTLVPHSRERIAILSAMYQFGAGGIPATLSLLTQNNDPQQRVKIWFELAYGWNDSSGGPASRRVLEGKTFGLFNSSSGSYGGNLIEAQQVLDFIFRGKFGSGLDVFTRIQNKEARFSNAYAGQGFLASIDLAKSDLESMFSGGEVVDAVYSGTAGVDTINASYSSSGKDLIFGKDGNDELAGKGQRDFIFGGLGSDTIEGGDGDDFLHGHTTDKNFVDDNR